jgi:hypothetical protein
MITVGGVGFEERRREMATGLLLVPMSLLASVAFLLDRFHQPPAELDDELLYGNGYGFAGIVAFIVTVSVLTLLALYAISP